MRHDLLRYDLLVLGGGFAGTLLGRVMAAEGARVAVVEREVHPRFALGESTTPLANLALERLAERHGFADLHSLAAHGRLVRDLPRIRHGLKRGFTFYRHGGQHPGRTSPQRALFAASPDDEIADTHWLREDVDAFLAEQAREAGVEVLEGTEVVDLDVGRRAEVAVVGPDGTRRRLAADRVVDATGAAGLVARRLRLEGPSPLPFPTALVAAHVPWTGSSLADPPEWDAEELPYPPENAAIHHFLDPRQASGWIYVLPFGKDDRASVGLVLRGDRDHAAIGQTSAQAFSTPGRTFRRVLDAHPHLRLEARPQNDWITASSLAYRRTRAAGDRWFLLPGAYAFLDPLFSTGIAWSLLGVERLRDVLLGARDPVAYDELLAAEADQMERLIESAWRAMDGDLDAFVSVALLYFGAVSWSETLQRLEEGPQARHSWHGFLGAGDPVLERAFRHARQRLRADEPVDGAVLRREVVEHLRDRDVAGLDQPPAPNVFPVDLQVLLARAGRLGRTRAEIEERLHRFRGVEPAESTPRTGAEPPSSYAYSDS